jgi:hypothetical protein
MIFARIRIGITVLCVMACVMFVTACGGNKCKSACKKVERCLGGGSVEDDNTTSPPAGMRITDGSDPSKSDEVISGIGTGSRTSSSASCSEIKECSELDECKAECILDASCDAIKGVDTAGALAMASCVAKCTSTIKSPPPTITSKVDGGMSFDSGFQWDTSVCIPDCYGKECGDDGCGGSCGTCAFGESCTYGTCSSSCTPDCYGKECGDDGCGGSCGTCGYGKTCDAYGTCTSTTTSTNSGQICTQATTCSATETCMSFDTTSTSGMCLGTCATAGDTCPVSGSSQMSICALTAQQNPSQYYCAYICEINGSTYSCPNSYDYDCKVLDTTQPSVKLCMPK